METIRLMAKTVPKMRMRNLERHFGPKFVLNDLDLKIFNGETVVIIVGFRNGKSELLTCLLCHIKPDYGSIIFDEIETISVNICQRAQINDSIGMLCQGTAQFFSLSVLGNLVFGLLRKNYSRKGVFETAITKLTQDGLGRGVRDRYPVELLADIKIRMCLASVITTDPEIIFFDKSTTGFDSIMGIIIDIFVVGFVEESGVTGFTINRGMLGASKIAYGVTIIFQIRIIWTGLTHKINDSDNENVDHSIHSYYDDPIQMAFRN